MNKNIEIFKKYLKDKKYFHKENVQMKDYTTFKIGGLCEILITPTNSLELENLILKCLEFGIKYHVVGKGSNLIVDDNGVDGVVILLGNKFSNISLIDEQTIECDSGTPTSKLSHFAYLNGLSGLEFAWGIPGSIGGAIYMNAGAFGGEIKDIIVRSSHIDKEGKCGVFNSQELALEYRKSAYSNKGFCIVKSIFALKKGNKKEIKSTMDNFMVKRIANQPIDYPNAGSVFKRPEGNYAGFLISECGLQGYTIGGAMVSKKHAGFIINFNNATCCDVLKLIDHIKAVVLNKTGYKLECEVMKI